MVFEAFSKLVISLIKQWYDLYG